MSASLVEVYRGSVNSWECDENKHLNVRFYGEKIFEGVTRFAALAGMPAAFAAGSASTLLPTDLHIRFLKEAHAGAALVIRAGVTEVEHRAARLYLEIAHRDGAVAAAFTVRVAHVIAADAAPLPWSVKTRAALEALTCTPPAYGLPRSVPMTRPDLDAVTLARADALGVPEVGRFAVGPRHCDVFGRMAPEMFIGRVSDAMAHIRSRHAPARNAPGDARAIGGAALEYRLNFRRWPRTGDLIDVRSSVVEANEKTRRLVHWMLDPLSGEAWAGAEAIAVAFDMATRKSIVMSDEERAAIMAEAIPAMRL
jgi:acyl-CoA thioester hydrolase